MNRDAVSAVAEMVGSAAMLVTLVYLAIQLRQHNRSVQATASATNCVMNSRTLSISSSNEQAADICQRGLNEPDSLTPTEYGWFENMQLQWFLAHWHAHTLYKNGLMDEDNWNTVLCDINNILACPGGLRVYEGWRALNARNHSFVALMDAAHVEAGRIQTPLLARKLPGATMQIVQRPATAMSGSPDLDRT
jgi:hypothetical protein